MARNAEQTMNNSQLAAFAALQVPALSRDEVATKTVW
jgi:hypothetical protein